MAASVGLLADDPETGWHLTLHVVFGDLARHTCFYLFFLFFGSISDLVEKSLVMLLNVAMPLTGIFFFFFFYSLRFRPSDWGFFGVFLFCFSSFFSSSFLSVANLAAVPFCCCFHPTLPHLSLNKD